MVIVTESDAVGFIPYFDYLLMLQQHIMPEILDNEGS